MRTIRWMPVVGIAAVLAATSVLAQDQSRQEMRSLDEQVQEIKSDVLTISRDLALLEERLLFPSSTQVSVFVEMSAEDMFRLDAVRIELEALQGGGVQRIYTGNITTGNHELTVAVNGKRSNGDDFTNSESFSISKGIDPQVVGLTLAEASGGASIDLGNW